MDGISSKIQQLGECKRPCVILLVVVLCICCAAFLLFVIDRKEMSSFGDDYIKMNTTLSQSV